MLVLQRRSMKSGVVRGFGGGGAATGIRACEADRPTLCSMLVDIARLGGC